MSERQEDPGVREQKPGEQLEPSKRDSDHTEDPRRKDTSDQLPEEGPEETTEQRSRSIHGRPATGLLAALAGLVVVGCGSSTFDSGSLNKSITSGLKSRGAISVSVHCPSSINVKKGGTFACPVVVNGRNGTVHATQTDSSGHFQYQVTFP